MANNLSGITYYGLHSEYEGDVTKNCGLTAGEIDNNFYFLRGRDIKKIEFDENRAKFIITRLDDSSVESDSINDYIIHFIDEALIPFGEKIDDLECQISGITDSFSGIYEEIDERFAEINVYINEFIEGVNQEITELSEELTEQINAAISQLSEDLNQRINQVEATLTELINQEKQEREDSEYVISKALNDLNTRVSGNSEDITNIYEILETIIDVGTSIEITGDDVEE